MFHPFFFISGTRNELRKNLQKMQLNLHAPWLKCWLAVGWNGGGVGSWERDGVVFFLYLYKKDLTTNDFMMEGNSNAWDLLSHQSES